MAENFVTIDGNEAAARVAHRLSEVIAIYPITPSSGMGELSDEWSAAGQKNIWGVIPSVVEMQSEGGAAGAVHGALQSGALTTTFTASQGLLLMIPNMFKIAGELTPTVFHVTARTIAAHALSIFGEHSDIYSVRSTGFGLLASNNVQEVMDNAAIATAASLKSRVPFVHFFDGFRTSHEVQKVLPLDDDLLRKLFDDKLIHDMRERALSPDHPVIRGTAQNPDAYFQAREACNPYYEKAPAIVQETMDEFAKLTGRQYKLFDYAGAPDAERIVILMGSGADAVHETVDYLTDKGEKVGVLKVHLYRPFSIDHFISSLPKSVKSIAVLDRTKEPGAAGEPLYVDVMSSLAESVSDGKLDKMPKVVGGRYGLSSKEFNPGMIKSVFDELKESKPKNHFTVGIKDDVSNTSLDWDPTFSVESDDVIRAKFYGLGADGTVGANKNSIKIIGDETDFFAQGYFVYDSKKSGAITTSHLRFGPKPIRSTYLISKANFAACHQSVFLNRYEMLEDVVEGGTFLLNTPASKDDVWATLPKEVQEQIVSKKLKFYVIDTNTVAKETGMGGRINTIMQTCFFAISGVLPREQAIESIKKAIKKTYGKKGDKIVQMNFKAVEETLANLFEVDVPNKVSATNTRPPVVSDKAPEYVRNVLGKMISRYGDLLPVSAFAPDGTFPTGTTQWEKRNIALEIPIWDKEVCIQCNRCSLVCPHAAIRPKVFTEDALKGAPDSFESRNYIAKDMGRTDLLYTLQVAPEDCTGCGLCVDVCPAKNKKEVRLKAINMESHAEHVDRERENYDFFLKIPDYDRTQLKVKSVKGSQFLEPLFEYSGACSGCGETPYVKLLTQLFGDRLMVANATGCSSIYGGNLPTTPYTFNKDGRGPAWANSLFEDNAEFGLGFRLSLDQHRYFAKELLTQMRDKVGTGLVDEILSADMTAETGITEQRNRVVELKKKLAGIKTVEADRLMMLADYLVKKSVWVLGGDGWGYDIGYGGLDHVLAQPRNVNIMIMDTGVYSNTGGQCSKATPMGAVAKFAASGKPVPRKDIGMIAMTYGSIYVAQIAMGANNLQAIKALVEAEAYDGPSLVIAYSHCIAHGIDMSRGLQNQKAAVECGAWPLYRFDPTLKAQGKNPMQLDSKEPTIKVKDWAYSEGRFKMLTKTNPEEAARLMEMAQADTMAHWAEYVKLAEK